MLLTAVLSLSGYGSLVRRPMVGSDGQHSDACRYRSAGRGRCRRVRRPR
ncbi:MAG: hypothetical protein AVDCRST_MAG60-2571 [uncultured Nocardioides sp.]|uniref:Uncharacterized protein n=1 Tax=uncultured Nocardioides sp. TaxID=198441 RepID=A0A6J4PFA5_9ACTN|nr:MAG: hypothetical protein AVDCRST_MAG60-2571 [uncultured Nocardioides sp.]